MVGMIASPRPAAHVSTMPKARKRIRRISRAVHACASLVRELTRLIWWTSASGVIIWVAVRTFLECDAATLVQLLTSLRPG